MNEQEEAYIRQMSSQLEAEKMHRAQQQLSGISTAFLGEDTQNLIKWQLDIKGELEEIEHLLKGHRLKRDENGNEHWVEPTDPTEKLLNDKGVQEILKILRMYLNKNTILSNYDQIVIDQRLKQFAERLADLIFMSYEEFGLDTGYKEKHYHMIVMNITDMVESAYNRAFEGGERESFRTARTVTQTEPLSSGAGNYPNSMGGQKRFSIVKPWTWV